MDGGKRITGLLEERFFPFKVLTALVLAVAGAFFLGKLLFAHIPIGGWEDYSEATYASAVKNLLAGKGTFWAPVCETFHPVFQVTPLAMYLEFYSSKILGFSEFSARLPSIVLSTSTIFFIFLIGALAFNRYVGMLAALLFSANSMFNIYGFNGITDSVFVFFMVLALYFYLRSLKEGNTNLFFLSGFVAGVGVFAKQTALLASIIVAATELSRFFCERIPFRLILKRSLVYLALSLSVAMPWFIHNTFVLGMEFIKHLDGDVTLGEVSFFRMFDFLWRTFEPQYLPLILWGLLLNFRKGLLNRALVIWFFTVALFLCFKNPHNYYTLPIIPVSYVFVSVSLYWLYSKITSRKALRVLQVFVILLLLISSAFTYKRFLNRKLGCDEFVQLRDYCNASSPRAVYALSGLYKVERFYIELPLDNFHDIATLEKEREVRNVFVYYRLADEAHAELARVLAGKASEKKIIYQTKYTFLLRKNLVPLFEVYKFNRLNKQDLLS